MKVIVSSVWVLDADDAVIVLFTAIVTYVQTHRDLQACKPELALGAVSYMSETVRDGETN